MRKAQSIIWRGGHWARRRPGESLLLARMAAWVIALSVGVKILSLPRVLSLLKPRRQRPAPRASAEAQKRLAQMLDALLGLDWLCFTPSCWKRAAVLNRYLALRGIETRIIFGVRQGEAGQLQGHAWLEAGGQPLLEKIPPDYIVTFSYPAAADCVR